MPKLRSWASPLAAVAVLGADPSAVALPTGFIDAAMEWDFHKEYREGDVTDEGYCSTRLEFLSNGKIRATHRYQRTGTKKSEQYDANARLVSKSYALGVQRSFRTDSTSRNPLPAMATVEEYPAVVRLVRHPDASVTPIMRPQLKTLRVAEHKLEWLEDVRSKRTDTIMSRATIVQVTCDAIDKFQSALHARHGILGSFPSLRDTATVTGMFTPAIPATIRGSWDLRP